MEEEFHSIINEIRPLAKQLSRNSERRHHVASWLKKLISNDCEIPLYRNHYAKQLLLALKSGVFHAPFNGEPPSSLSQVDELDSVLCSTMKKKTHQSLPLTPPPPLRPPPDDLHYTPPTKERGLFHSTPVDNRRAHGMTSRVAPQGFHRNSARKWTSPEESKKIKQRNSRRILTFSSSDSLDELGSTNPVLNDDSVDFDTTAGSSTIHYSSSSSFSYSSDDLTDVSSIQPNIKQRLSLSDVPLSTRTKGQQHPHLPPHRKSSFTSPSHHTARVNHPSTQHGRVHSMDIKNKEIEDMKRRHLLQVKKLENRCSNLEDTVKDLGTAEQDKLKGSSRKLKNKQIQLLQSSYEKKLQTMMREFEDKQFNLRQTHIQEMKQTMDRAKMAVEHLKTEHCKQQQDMSNSISNMESRLQRSVQSMEDAKRNNRKLMKEKNSLTETISTLESKLKSSEKSIKSLEEEITQLAEENKVLQSKGDVSVEAIKKQMAEQRSVFLRKIGSLQQQVGKLQTDLEEQANKQNIKLENAENLRQLSSKETEVEYQKKIIDLKSTLQEKEQRCRELELMLSSLTKASEHQVNEVKCAYESQCTSIEEYRTKIEQQMKGMLGDMTNEIKRLESELGEEHRLRKTKEEELYCELSSQRARMTAEHSALVKSIKEQFLSELEAKDQTIQEITIQTKEQTAKLKSELEQKHQALKEAKQTIVNLNAQVQEMLRTHHEKLDGTRKAYENDKQLMEENQERIVNDMKSELEKHHQLEVASLTEKHKIQLRQMEHDQNMKVAIANETIGSLQSQNRITKEDLDRLMEAHRKEMDNRMKQFEWDMRSLEQQYEAEKKVMAESIDNYRNASEQLETRIGNLQQTYEHELSRLKNDYEYRMIHTHHIMTPQDSQEVVQSLQMQLQIMTDKANCLQRQVDQSVTCAKIKRHLSLATPTATPTPFCSTTRNIMK